jgi:hypothetical protein
LFNWMRDTILGQLALDNFVETPATKGSAEVEVAQGLSPEPFFLALDRSHVPVAAWLESVLSAGKPTLPTSPSLSWRRPAPECGR